MEKTAEKNRVATKNEEPIKPDKILQLAYENVVFHVSNIERVQIILDKLKCDSLSIDECLSELSKISKDGDITFRTDIKILLNEIRHLVAGQK
jgi:hypothetical protein